MFRILYQDEYLIAVDKPAGYQVHTPESMIQRGERLRTNNVMKMLRKQTGKYVYPVHRLDRATSGVLLFAFTSEVASQLQEQFKKHEVQKTYVAFIRGWVTAEGEYDSPLDERDAHTAFSTLYQFVAPFPSGAHASSRYALVEVRPQTGRFHQIRRHFKSASHPLIGDSVYGDGKHNRYWAEQVKAKGLFLKAYSLTITHPVTQVRFTVTSKWNGRWHALFDAIGFCPYLK